MSLALVVVAGCQCGDSSTKAPPPPPAVARDAMPEASGNRAISDAESTKVIGCILDDVRSSREVFSVLGNHLAPAAVIHRAVDAALARAARDGESRVATVLFDAVDAYMEALDRDGLRATFQAIDKLSDTNSTLFNHHGPQRTFAGLDVAAKDFAGDDLEILTERALAGDKAGAARQLDAMTQKEGSARDFVGLFVALDRVADAKKKLADAKPDDRTQIAGAWLGVALRMKAPLDEALQIVVAEIGAASDKALMWFPQRDLFRRAVRLGRGRELAPLYKALRARYEKSIENPQARLELAYDLARAVGAVDDVKALEREPGLAATVAARTGSIEAALARAKGQKHPEADYTAIWLRASTEPVPPGFGAVLATTICPPEAAPAKPAAPPLAGAKLVANEKSRGMRQECELHDVVVTLTDASGKQLGSETIEGECTGACTAAEKRAGQKSLDEIQKRIEAGEASESETDYNFTDCMFRGPDEGIPGNVAGRQLVLIPIHGIGPHDVPNTSYQIAIEVCGGLHLLDGFGVMYAHNWKPEDLTLRESPDKSQIIIDGTSDFWNGVVARITLPAECPGDPTFESLETE